VRFLTVLFLFLFLKEEVPLEAQVFVTAALRNLSACSVGFLLYRTLVPTEHPWHFSALKSFFSLPIWQHIAAISFVSYLVHFRLLMEMIYSVPMQKFFGLTFPTVEASSESDADALATEWLLVMVKVFVIGIGVSFFIAKLIHEFVEKPTGVAIQKHLLPSRKTQVGDKKSQ
jgi:peptidoglycan/LPS O-acetylase OafA/YrhL